MPSPARSPSPPAPRLAPAPRKRLLEAAQGGAPSKRPALPGQPTPDGKHVSRASGHAQGSMSGRNSYGSRSTRDTHRLSVASADSEPIILPIGRTPVQEKTSFSSESFSSNSSKGKGKGQGKGSNRHNAIDLNRSGSKELIDLEAKKEMFLKKQRERIAQKTMPKPPAAASQPPKPKTTGGGVKMALHHREQQQQQQQQQRASPPNVVKDSSSRSFGSGSSGTEPTPSRSLSMRSSPSASASEGRSRPGSNVPSASRSMSRSPSPSPSEGSEAGTTAQALDLQNIQIRNVTVQAKKAADELKEATARYMSTQQRRKKADDTASNVEWTISNIHNSAGRFLEKKAQLESRKTHLELNISELEQDELLFRDELQPVQEEARVAREAVDRELADMDLPPKHRNGLEEAFESVGGSFDIIRQMPIWTLDQKCEEVETRLKVCSSKLNECLLNLTRSRDEVASVDTELEQVNRDLASRGYDEDSLSKLQEKLDNARISTNTVVEHESELRKVFRAAQEQNSKMQTALKMGQGGPKELCIKTYCTKGDAFDDESIGNFRQALAALVFECRLFLGDMAMTPEIIQKLKDEVEHNGKDQILAVSGQKMVRIGGGSSNSPSSSPCPSDDESGSASGFSKLQSDIDGPKFKKVMQHLFMRTTSQQCRVLHTWEQTVEHQVRRASSFEVLRACLWPGIKHFFVLDPHLRNWILKKVTRVPNLPIPQGITANLRHYQEKGYKWLCMNADNGFGSILADDMGLGKTLQAICLIAYLRSRKSRPVCVVVPASLIANWQRELRTWAPFLKVLTYHGSGRSLDFMRGTYNASNKMQCNTSRSGHLDIVLTTYGVVRSDVDLFEKTIGFEAVILDETQAIKNYGAKISIAVKRMADLVQCNVRVALSGTPVENRLEELHSIYEFTMPSYFESRESFKKNFSRPLTKGTSTKASAVTETAVAQSARAQQRLLALTSPFQLRRVKTDKKVIADLPDKIENDVTTLLVPDQKKLYESIRKKKMLEIEECRQQNKGKNVRYSKLNFDKAEIVL